MILTAPLCISPPSWANPINLAEGNKEATAALFNSSPAVHGINGTNSSINWNFCPLFHDFKNGTNVHVDRPDEEVFLFTEDNIRNSDVQLWYASWSRKSQTDPRWALHGEMYLFAMEFLKNGDCSCEISKASCYRPNRDRILRHWPGPANRALAQRIYLQLTMQHMDHAKQTQEVVCCKIHRKPKL
jgi:hypothetical protein